MGEIRNVYKKLVTKNEKKPLRKPTRGWEENIKTELTEKRCEDVDCIHIAQIGSSGRLLWTR
jgi:hypothetical protein